MNVNVENLRAELDERVMLGRSPVEAVGERLWLTTFERDAGILSHQTTQDTADVASQWLRDRLENPDMHSLALRQAEELAVFIRPRVSMDLTHNASVELDEAVQAWRAR